MKTDIEATKKPRDSSKSEVAFLGPDGTFAHLAVLERYKDGANLHPCADIPEVFDFVARGRDRLGVVPIENSSGGTIYPTVDRLLDFANYGFFIQEQLSINVKLALLGKRGREIHTVYSHPAPLHHCEEWLKLHYPSAEQVETSSTTKAAQIASQKEDAAAISTRYAGELYSLDILHFPIEEGIKNITQFIVIGHQRPNPKHADQTTMVVSLGNQSGVLHKFLGPFAEENVNLSRILSRPIQGQPNSYVFYIDIVGKETDANVQNAIRKAERIAEKIRMIGSYPVIETFES